MKRIGVFDESLIVVTSDHGEEFLDHGAWEHQKTLYEEQLRIPLLFKMPRGRGGSGRVSGQVSLVDVAPTVSDALGLQAPPSYQGRSLLQAIDEGDGDSAKDVWSETEHTLDGSHKLSLRRGASGAKAIFTMADDGSTAIELFDLGDDRFEQHPLDASGSLAGLMKRLEAYLSDSARHREGRSAVPAVDLDADELERLRSLGYVR